MSKFRLLGMLVLFLSTPSNAWDDFAFIPRAKQASYIEKWDSFAKGATTSYWEWIKKTEQNTQNNALNDVKIKIIPHSSNLSFCLGLAGLANTELSGNTKTIEICARQLRFVLHLLDAFTTTVMITSDNSIELKNALSTGDTKKAERILLPSNQLLDAYSEYLRLQVKRDILIIGKDKYRPLSVCGPDFFYMKMTLKEDFMNCDVDEQFSRLNEFDTWYFSAGGPGWIFSSAVKRETGKDIDRADVKKNWDTLHENVNRAAIIFILMHEAGHISNGDLQPDNKTPHGQDVTLEARADLWAMKKMMEKKVFSPPEILPYFLRIIIINVRYYEEYDPKNGSYQPSDLTVERLKYFNDYLNELSKLHDSNEKNRLQKQVLINLINTK